MIAPDAPQAAAITAAIERFLHDTAPPAQAPAAGPDPWIQAAMLERVRRETHLDVSHPWINT